MFVKTLKPFVFLVVVMAMVSLACFGSTETPTAEPPLPPPTEEPQQPQQPEQPAQTEEPAATEEPTAPTAQEFFTEEFDSDISNWSYFNILGSKETNESALTLETDSGYLVFNIATKELYTYVMYDPFEYRNVAIELRAENRGTNNNAISMVCRYSDEGWYEINIQNSGLYNILAATYNPSDEIVYARLADGGSNKIKVGKDINEYKMICKERTIILYINGYETRTIEDNQYVLRDGQVGFSVSSFSDPTVKVEVDWVRISEP
ncbi:MAG: hypothetical protein JW963_20460 [Anaerolineales bacterium]|nr:hypothetical protein [Anaerolineales bacterium]